MGFLPFLRIMRTACGPPLEEARKRKDPVSAGFINALRWRAGGDNE